jgi:hypothetical protein
MKMCLSQIHISCNISVSKVTGLGLDDAGLILSRVTHFTFTFRLAVGPVSLLSVRYQELLLRD